MKFAETPKKKWHSPSELEGRFNRLSKQLNRLMILEHVWKKLVGDKDRFWKLVAVQKGSLQVEVKLSVARNELIARREMLLKELNKHFDKPWIEKIEIVKNLGVSK